MNRRAEFPFMADATDAFNVVATETSFKAVLYLDPDKTWEDAKAIAAQFPKAHRVHGGRGLFDAGRQFPSVSIEVDLRPDGVKGERNEAGESRARNFVKAARKLGYRFEVQIRQVSNFSDGPVGGTPVTEAEQIATAERWIGRVPVAIGDDGLGAKAVA